MVTYIDAWPKRRNKNVIWIGDFRHQDYEIATRAIDFLILYLMQSALIRGLGLKYQIICKGILGGK